MAAPLADDASSVSIAISYDSDDVQDVPTSLTVAFPKGAKTLDTTADRQVRDFAAALATEVRVRLSRGVALPQVTVIGRGNALFGADRTGAQRAQAVASTIAEVLRKEVNSAFPDFVPGSIVTQKSAGRQLPASTVLPGQPNQARRRTAELTVMFPEDSASSEQEAGMSQTRTLDASAAAFLTSRNVYMTADSAGDLSTGFIPEPGDLQVGDDPSPDWALPALHPVDLSRLQANGQGGSLKFRQDTSLLFRWETQRSTYSDFDEVFGNGFEPKNPKGYPDVEEYKSSNSPSMFVSTTRSPVAQSVGWGTSYRYLIDAPGGVDVKATLPHSPLAEIEDEVAFPGGIRRDFIVGVEVVNGTHLNSKTGKYADTVEFVPNPYYNPAHRPEVVIADARFHAIANAVQDASRSRPGDVAAARQKAREIGESRVGGGSRATEAYERITYAYLTGGPDVADRTAQRIGERESHNHPSNGGPGRTDVAAAAHMRSPGFVGGSSAPVIASASQPVVQPQTQVVRGL